MVDRDERYVRWLDLTGQLLGQPLVVLPHELIACELMATFDAAVVSYNWSDGGGNAGLRAWSNQVNRHPKSITDPITRRNPLLRYHNATGDTAARSLGEVPSEIADGSCLAAWRDVSVPWRIDQQLSIPLQVHGLAHRAFVLARPERDFRQDEIALARTLQPLLIGLDRQAAALAQWQRRAPCTKESCERLDDGLTAREVAVLSLLAEGVTARAIGHRLKISPRTVTKHLEHIYAKLHTSDRLTTVLRAQHLGLLPPASD